MLRPFANSEFFTHESEVWFRCGTEMKMLSESDTDIISSLIDHISTFYPKAYDALCSEYRGCAMNRTYYRWRIVSRFIRCNFAQHDNIPDISDSSQCVFEYIPCPLRGECRFERVICRPQFDHKLSAAEMPVMRLWYNGAGIDEIAEHLRLSPHTVHNHVRNAYQRLNIHSRAEFVKYASQANLFS